MRGISYYAPLVLWVGMRMTVSSSIRTRGVCLNRSRSEGLVLYALKVGVVLWGQFSLIHPVHRAIHELYYMCM